MKASTVMVNDSTNINKSNSTSHFKPLNMKRTTTYGIGNQGLGMRQAQTCYGVVCLFTLK
jgi:hypothetical protein